MYDYKGEPEGDFLCVDMKSFYASTECVERGYHPLTKMLVVMSRAKNTGNGLVLAASPAAKKKLGISNVTRANSLPNDPELEIVSPRMNLYIKKNLEVNNIFRRFVADEDLLEYSIDESFLYLTPSLSYFRKSAEELGRDIQKTVLKETGLYCTVGLGSNPLLAKLSMDLEAKKNDDMFAVWRYQDVPKKLWPVSPLSEVWGIGSRLEKRLNQRGIMTVGDLAHYNPYLLKDSLGVIGEQLFAHSWGVDRTSFLDPLPTQSKEKSIGNSQVLPRNYEKSEAIVVLKEICQQVASRLRKRHAQTACVHLGVGYAWNDGKTGFSHQKKIPLTNQTKKLTEYILTLFETYYSPGQAVRNLSVTYSQLVFSEDMQLSLFEEPTKEIQQMDLDYLIDYIREKFGFPSIVYASSLLESATALERSKLVGGHAGGNEGINQGSARYEY